ncbi:MAG: MtnX-like HAD-IB family phosphatase [Syntrophomonadaceae bacterium]|jgi:2-hydroxy-3-keto-5-methylthiopentenyl-1-phosphate phosphatase|nr:MtnX-like HAD-IB family phosphatase [Syntrophomonadaceae bacterium]
MEEVDYIFFVDFDGTIATVDVCEKMVAAFAGDGWQEINEMWERKELSTLECARQTLKLFRTNDPADFFSLLNNVTIDPGFPLFLTYCRERNFPVVILSDGYSFYIEHLLRREGIELPYYANTMVFRPELDIEAPYISERCDLCGVCKLELMQKLAPAAEKTVYVGDGYSDFCPAQSADVVFGKARLYEHCLREGKTVFHFTDFADIVQQLRIMNKE